jgi:Flp pilus assembly protein TadB
MIRASLYGAIAAIGLNLVAQTSLIVRVRDRITQLTHHSVVQLRNYTSSRSQSDLMICDVNAATLVANKLVGAVVGFTASGFALVFIGSALFNFGIGVSALFMVIAATAGFFLPEQQLRKLANARRRSFLHSFSSFLDLTNILLAGGAGTETALIAASESGDGWAFEQIRRALTIARSSRTSPWAELARLGELYSLMQIQEIAGSIQLAGEHGARIRASLAARAESLRYQQMSEVESSANAATERMGLPMVLLFVSFIVLIGYPAVTLVIGGL